MKPEKLTIYDLFIRERRYIVPLYQRAYVWKEQSQWEPLWEDIERLAEACIAEPNSGGTRSHFLGAIVLNVAKIVGSGVARSEIIDGQQRLTTLQLFLAALRDYAVSLNSQQTERLKALTLNPYQTEGSDTSFKVWPTNADRETFRTVLTSKSPKGLLDALGVSAAGAALFLAQAYFYFFQRVAEFAGSGDIGQQETRLLGLTQALRTALQLVVIELESHDDPQVIFKRWICAGSICCFRFKSAITYLCRPLLRRAKRTDCTIAFGVRSMTCSNVDTVKGGNRFWHLEERQGRLTRPRIDLFLFHYLVMKRERELNIGQLFREFKEWREAEGGSTEALLAALKGYSGLFSKLISPTGKIEWRLSPRNSKHWTTAPSTRCCSMCCHVIRTGYLSKPAVRFWPIWNLRYCGGSSASSLTRTITTFLPHYWRRRSGSRSTAISPEVVRAELSRSVKSTGRWPSDAEFQTAWLSDPLYARTAA